MLPSFIKRTKSTAAKAAKKLPWKKFELQMWKTYQAVAPQSNKIHKLFCEQGERLINDHVAFRTYNHDKVNINVFEDNLYKHHGYKPIHEYNIPEKHLTAKHFEHSENPSQYPLIFVSQFNIETLNISNQCTINEMMDTIDPNYDPINDDTFLISNRIWDPITVDQYESLSLESQYASWVAAFGYVPNHFTVSVNYLHKYTTIQSVNKFLENHGFKLNQFGGKIKGNDNVGLMQSSTMAPLIEATFKDGKMKIPGAYYEFAQRFVIEGNKNHELFSGFVEEQANKIFESTYFKCGCVLCTISDEKF